MKWRLFAFFLYALALVPAALAIGLSPYAMLWGYGPLTAWPMQLFMLVVSGMLIWGGRTVSRH